MRVLLLMIAGMLFSAPIYSLENTPIKDIFKQDIILQKSRFPLRLFLFFSKEQQKIFEQTKQTLFNKIYNDPNIEIYLILQRKKFNPLIRRKLTKELQKDFKQENELRQSQIKKMTPFNAALPGYFLLVDFDGKISEQFKLPSINETPIAVFLDSEGKILTQFNSDQIAECLKWIESQRNQSVESKHVA